MDQLLSVTPRQHKDIKTTIDSLTTRVHDTYEDDWGKLKRLLRYILCTIYMHLILQEGTLYIITWWVDASYSIHQDCQRNMGETKYFGKGLDSSMSKQQKRNTRSLIEEKLVGADDGIPQFLWTRYFME